MTTLIVITTSNLLGQMARVPGEMLVQLKSGINAQNLAEDYDWLVEGKLISRPMNIHQFFFEDGENANTLLEIIKSNKKVTDAQFNHVVKRRTAEINDPQYPTQWHHDNTGQNGGSPDADIDSDLAWGITTGGLTANGDTIVVCVIEGGNLNHTDLQANAWRNYNEIPNNNIDDDGNGYIDDYLGWDVNSNSDGGSVLFGPHGTNVMGMIGATGGNEIAVIGANWDVKIMSVAGQNIFNEASVISAYSYPLEMRKLYNQTEGELGAFVVATNASWGIDGGNPNAVPLWNNMYDSLGTHGVLNCGSTSNLPLNVDVEGDIPTALPSDYMVSVTATNSSDVRTFSGFGATTIDVGAPGEAVVTTDGNNGVVSTSGTSFASPLTAGVIALLYSAPCQEFADFILENPQGGADFVRQSLFDGVDIKPNLIGETVTGGRINAFNSLVRVLDFCSDEDFCFPPLAFSSQLSNDTVYTLSWVNVGEIPFTVRFKPENSEEWYVIDNVTETELVLDTLSICTNYDVEIGAPCGEEGEVIFSSSLTIATLGCCVSPEEFETDTEAETEVEVEWSTDFGISSYNLYYRVLNTDEWIFFGNFTEVNEVVITGLEACTDYEFLVSPSCAEDMESGTITTERTKGCGACLDNDYCTSLGENSSDEYIQTLAIGEFEFNTGNNGGYVFFDDSDLSLIRGETYSIQANPGFSGQQFDEYFKIWIDFNQSGSFTTSEIILESEAGSPNAVSGEFTVPEGADLGSTRMRVAMKYVGPPITNENVFACEDYDWGETEDYCLTIEELTSVDENNPLAFFNIFPNPSSTDFNLNFKLANQLSSEQVRFRMIDISGKEVISLEIIEGSHQINVAQVESGLYLYSLETNDGKTLKAGKWVKSR